MSLDINELRTVTKGDQALEQQIFTLFRDTGQRCLEAMLAHAANNGTEWGDEAHELKGAAASIGAHGMYGLCMQVEAAQSESERLRFLKEMQEEMTSVLAQIKTLGYSL